MRDAGFNIFVWVVLGLYLLPVAFMMVTALMPTSQLGDSRSPLYPAKIRQYEYQGTSYQVYHVPTADGEQRWALVKPGARSSQFVDPDDPQAGLITWQGDANTLAPVYEFAPTWENLTILFRALPFPRMLFNTFLLTLIGEIAVVSSSIVAAYGFARFPLPGGNFLFYLMIATILIPDKITFIPTYFFNIIVMDWRGTLYPILLPLFFGNAVYIFLFRQNFKSLPIELEEAAMMDGANPLQRLWSVVLPQSWPVIITVSLLHFFYTWNETRLASAYLIGTKTWMPVSFGVQNYQSRLPIENVIQAATLVVIAIPLVVLLVSQKFFMQGILITGGEKH
jgi:ABC-type glycerol-3-phosphate transport system permease component